MFLFRGDNMEVYLNNVGIVKNSTIKIDGLTVITGKNNAGKTTVGKVAYSLVQACGNADKVYDAYKSEYIKSQLNVLAGLLLEKAGLFAFYLKRYTPNKVEATSGNFLEALGSFTYMEFTPKELVNFIYTIDEELPNLTFKDYQTVMNKYYNTTIYGRKNKISEKKFKERKKNALDFFEQTKENITNIKMFTNFENERIKRSLNSICNDQINPAREPESIANIKICENEQRLLELKIKNKDDYAIKTDTAFALTLNQAIFIDDAFVIDNMASEVQKLLSDRNSSDNLMIGVVPHRHHLLTLLAKKAPDNYFESIEIQYKYRNVIKLINSIVPGEFQISQNGIFYVEEKVALNVRNLATGSKVFFMIKLLLANGSLNEHTLLVLDEPECHLHPEWINKFTEILLLLVKEIKIRVLVTTHSPNFLLGLDLYSKKLDLKEQTHFYLSKPVEKSYATSFACIDDDINEAYAHLSIPLLEMTASQQEYLEQEEDS